MVARPNHKRKDCSPIASVESVLRKNLKHKRKSKNMLRQGEWMCTHRHPIHVIVKAAACQAFDSNLTSTCRQISEMSANILLSEKNIKLLCAILLSIRVYNITSFFAGNIRRFVWVLQIINHVATLGIMFGCVILHLLRGCILGIRFPLLIQHVYVCCPMNFCSLTLINSVTRWTGPMAHD